MPVIMTMSLLPDSNNQLRGFIQFWLKYVHGFSPHFHCKKSLRGMNDSRFTKNMTIGTSYELLEPKGHHYIYLCGVTSKNLPGLHMALLPEIGATAYTQAYNGLEIMVVGARQLEIPVLPDGYAGMSRKYTTCCNWQFGVMYYGLANMRRELVRD